jgi:hypothetical protein
LIYILIFRIDIGQIGDRKAQCDDRRKHPDIDHPKAMRHEVDANWNERSQ